MAKSFEQHQDLVLKVQRILNSSYYRFYETSGDVDLLKALEEVFEIIGRDTDLGIVHKRYTFIAYSVGLSSAMTFKTWYPMVKEPIKALRFVKKWLETNCAISNGFLEEHFPVDYEIKGHTAGFDSYMLLEEMVRVLINDESLNSLITMMELTFEGEALTNNPKLLRNALNWLLSDVVPSSYTLSFPKEVFNISGLIKINEYESLIFQE